MLSIKPNCIKSKSHNDNYDKSNCKIGNKVDNKEQKLNNLEDFE